MGYNRIHVGGGGGVRVPIWRTQGTGETLKQTTKFQMQFS